MSLDEEFKPPSSTEQHPGPHVCMATLVHTLLHMHLFGNLQFFESDFQTRFQVNNPNFQRFILRLSSGIKKLKGKKIIFGIMYFPQFSSPLLKGKRKKVIFINFFLIFLIKHNLKNILRKMIFLYLDVIRKDEVKSGPWKIRVLFSRKVYFLIIFYLSTFSFKFKQNKYFIKFYCFSSLIIFILIFFSLTFWESSII